MSLATNIVDALRGFKQNRTWLIINRPEKRRAAAADAILRIIVTAAHKLLQLGWFRARRRGPGAHALALTPEGKIILVKLRYARGWRVPGGGRTPGEEPAAAVLRELREEIGMTSHGRVRPPSNCDIPAAEDSGKSTLLIVEDVRYRSRNWSLEVEQVRAFDLRDLPRGTTPLTRRWIALLDTKS